MPLDGEYDLSQLAIEAPGPSLCVNAYCHLQHCGI